MDEPFEYEDTGGRQRIIKRPRLTGMLDNAEERILLLLAPAGFGKTTLARQWLAELDRASGWYTGGPAANDVAALCLELAAAARAVVPGAGYRLRDRLTASSTPEREVQILAELLAEDLVDWPENAWLAFDDYQFAERPAAEEFVEILLHLAPVHMILTSRRRPAWATARQVLGGEIFEVDAAALSMTDAEARAVLRPGSKPEAVNRLLERAEGWPAVIALASLSKPEALPADVLPPMLFDYFAEELYRALSPELQEALQQLAAGATVDIELCSFLFGPDAPQLVEGSIDAGFLIRLSDRTLVMHPLLRAFLRVNRRETADGALDSTAHEIGEFYLDGERWDDAFTVAKDLGDGPSLHAALERALEPLVSSGRVATLEEWVSYADTRSIGGPLVQLARAHIDQRSGLADRAELLALQAADSLSWNPRLVANALLVAARSAHLAERSAASLDHLRAARPLAEDEGQLREIVWSTFCAAADVVPRDAPDLFAEFTSLGDGSVDHLLRTATGHMYLSIRNGGIGTQVQRYYCLLDLASLARDPTVATGYLNCLASSLIAVNRYRDAAEVSQREITTAVSSKLGFVLPYGWLFRGLAAYGMREFRDAHKMLDRASSFAKQASALHAETAIAVALALLLLAEGAADDALRVTETDSLSSATPNVAAELEATRALALACSNRQRDALLLADQAHERSSDMEGRALAEWVRALVALQTEPVTAGDQIASAIELMRVSDNSHYFVSAYRAHPPLLAAAAPFLERSRLIQIVAGANDHQLARTLGLDLPRLPQTRGAQLSRRELEVHGLLTEGRSNRQIAHALYISEKTVKVHVRHIFEKLGVRTRTEAALKHVDRP